MKLIPEDQIVAEFSERFEYISDRNHYDQRDAWYIMESKDGKFYGDCEDYALTLLYLLCNRSLFKFWFYLFTRRAKLQYCKTKRGVGHGVLVYKSKYVDNIQKKFVTKKDMIDAGYRFETNQFSATTVAIRMGIGFLIRLFKDMYSY